MELGGRNYEDLVGQAKRFYFLYPTLQSKMEVEDFIQDVVERCLKFGVFEKFEPSRTSFKYYISRIVQTIAINGIRKKPTLRECDFNETESGETVLTLHVAPKYETLESDELLKKALSFLDESESRVRVPVFIKEFEMHLAMTWRNILVMKLKGYRTGEIAKFFGVTSGCISNLYKEVKSLLQEWWVSQNFKSQEAVVFQNVSGQGILFS